MAPDFTRSVLYVGAMNYSLLVQRSVDFDPFGAVLDARYPDPLQRPLIISLLQVLWDRGEPNGYAWHMTGDPYPNTPRHRVLQIESFGDHQVANVATEIQARTIGAHVRTPILDPGRSASAGRLRIPRLRQATATATRSWWSGTSGPAAPRRTWARRRRRRPTSRRVGVDPHDLVIESEARVRRQIAEWLRIDGALRRRLRRSGAAAAGWTGPGRP